jgi:two-component system, NarL family, response regulator
MKTMQTPIRILLADDHVILREGLASLLNMEPDMQVIAQASTGRNAVNLYREHRPDVSLFDIEMPDGNGPEAISVIHTFDATAKVIILTTYMGEEDVFKAVEAGARGYLLKDEETDVLLACVRKVAAGGKHMSSQVAEKLSDRRPGEQLSERETDVLRLLAEGKVNGQIARQLKMSESTVKFHVNNVFSKLHVSHRAEAIVVAVRKGLLRLT